MIYLGVGYLGIGFLWAIFCLHMTFKLKYPKAKFHKRLFGFFVNMLVWPISVIVGIEKLRE